MYIVQRIFHSDVVILFSNGVVDQKTQTNKCRIRTALDQIWQLKIPVQKMGLPTDETQIDNDVPWRDRIINDVRRGYRGLPFAKRAEELARRSFTDAQDDWFVNALMNSMTATLEFMDWGKKDIIRGSTLQRRRYNDESEFVLNLCLEAGVDKLYGGSRMLRELRPRLFKENQVELEVQRWDGTQQINALDSALDLISRYDLSEIPEILR